MSKPHRILIFQGGKLGDVICMTPVFRAIKEKYPEAFVVTTVDKITKQILAGNPNVDQCVLREDLDLKTIKSLKLDTAVLLGPSHDILIKLFLSGVFNIITPKIVGSYSPYPTKLFKILSFLTTRVPHRMYHYAPQEYLNMLVPLGIYSNNTKKDVYIEQNVYPEIDILLSVAGDRKRVAIAPGAGNSIKEWPPEKFGELAKILVERHNTVIVLIGSEKDLPLGSVVKQFLPTSSVVDTMGCSIDQLKYIVSKVNLFVSADTGPIYVAEAFGIPTVDIVGPVDEREQPPQGKKHLIVLPPERKKPELYVMNARIFDPKEAERLASSTRVEDVLGAVEKLLK